MAECILYTLMHRYMYKYYAEYCSNKGRGFPPGTSRHFDINDWSKLGPNVILIA